jgi:hypothetical protein
MGKEFLTKDFSASEFRSYDFGAYNIAVSLIVIAQQVPVVENCFGFMFTNLGDTAASVNGMLVFPSATPLTALGDSRSIGGHLMDLYKGNLTVAFIQPVGVNPKLELVQLFYLPYRNKPATL